MKHSKLSLLATVSFALAATPAASLLGVKSVSAGESGGGHVGGGGGWTCRDNDGKLRWIRTLDLDEGRRVFVGFNHLPMGDEPQFAKRTTEDWLNLAEQNMFLASPGFYSKYLFAKNHVNGVLKEVASSRFSSTNDFLTRTAPKADEFCQGGIIPEKPEQLAIFDDTLGVLEINGELWNSDKLLPMERAALLMHETIYYMMRTKAKHTDSSRTRQKVAFLFSDMPISSYSSMFAMSTLLPDGVWLPSSGLYTPVADGGHHFAGVVIDSFDTLSGVLKLTQKNTSTGENLSNSRFHCLKMILESGKDGESDKYEYSCTMNYTSVRSTRWLHRMGRHEIKIKDSGSFLWLNVRGSGVTWITTYLRSSTADTKRFD